MNKLIFIISLFAFSGQLFGQATSCEIADPFCTGVTYGFPMNTSTTAQVGPNYSCLFTQPNPVWYYLLIDQPGNITINMTSPTGNDIDFTAWGPFSSMSGICSQLTATCSTCPNNTDDPTFYPAGAGGTTIDCSYDPAEFENVHISNAITGQYYLLCITNFENTAGDIVFSQSNVGQPGAGSTNCAIITPCDITAATANPTACTPGTNLYDVSGTITFHDAPTTGQIVVSDNAGASQTINLPFTSPANYNLTNLNSDGTTHTITISFTDDQFCNYSLTYTAPGPCNACTANAGPDQSVCSLTTNLAAVTQAGDVNLAWSGPAGITFTSPNSANTSVTATSTGQYILTWTITNSLGNTCSDNVTINFNTIPTPSITGNLTICSGAATTLDAGAGYTSYIWSPSGNTQTINVTTAGTYAVTVTNASGCTGTASVNVIVNSSLSPTVTGNDFCTGSSSLLDVGGGYSTYLWSTTETTQTINVFATGTYFVTVSNATGCSGIGQVTVNQIPNPVPDISGPLSFCVGFSTTINAGAGFASYLWSDNSTNQTLLVNSAGNYSVTVTNSSGCTGTDLVTTTVYNGLTPAITGNVQICSGSSTALDAGTGYSGYIWSNSLNMQTISVNAAGNYSVTVNDINGCTGSATTTVSLNPSPTTSITGDLSMCWGETTLLDAGSGFASYSWTGGILSQTLSVNSSGIYTVTVTNAFGCTGTASATVVESSNVIVSALTSHSICSGEWAYLTATASGGTAPYVYYWNNTASSASIGVQPAIPTSYTVSVTDANGCVSNLVNVNVFVSLPLIVDVEALPTSICPNDPVQLSVNITQGGGPPYSIFTSNGTVLVPPISVSPQNSGLQWLYVQDGCGSIAHDSVFITVNTPPVVNFVSDTTAGCEPLTVSFTPMNPQPGQTYFWDFGDGSYNQISYDMNPAHGFAQDGLFDVSLTITSPEGCSSTYMHNDMIHVYPLPSARFVALPSSASIVKPEIHFINYTDFASSYIWSFGDGDSSSVMHPWHWYSALGSYLVQLIAISDMGCTDTVRSVVVIRDEYTFYAPNVISPDLDELNDVFYVVGNGISKKDFHMYIYDRWGEIIFETDKYDPDPEIAKQLGWDGRAKNGAIVPVGTYTWLVKYYDGDHIQHDRTGAVNVIR